MPGMNIWLGPSSALTFKNMLSLMFLFNGVSISFVYKMCNSVKQVTNKNFGHYHIIKVKIKKNVNIILTSAISWTHF